MSIKKVITIAILIFSVVGISNAQDEVPTLKGKMNLSISQGTIECDFKLIDIPQIKDYVILLNTGLNIRYFRNIEDDYNYSYRRIYSDTIAYESFGYYFPDNTGKEKFIPNTLQFSYVGKFPVIADTLKASNSSDWKGNIAFNGYSVRADGRQTAWYPVLYDLKSDIKYDRLKYDIEITCKDCNTIYVNGNAPIQATTVHLTSEKPRELMLFAGKYNTVNIGGTYFLNPDISVEQMKEFGEMTNTFKKYYGKKLLIPYKDNITYIQTTPVTKSNAWLFVSYPTIVNIGHGNYGMKGFFDEETGDWFKPFMAHELGHYYFGSYAKFNSELGDMISESFPEFLSLKIAKDILKDTIYVGKIKEKIKALKGFSPIPFAAIKAEKDYKDRNLYVYSYAPIILTAIEGEIGEKDMWRWMKILLETKSDFTNYKFLEQTLRTTLKDEKKLQTIKEKYFQSDNSVENAIKMIAEQ